MTSKERVLNSFEGKIPDRVPRWFGTSPEFLEKAERTTGLDEEGLRKKVGDDFRRVFAEYRGPEHQLSEGATWRSPFGIEREGLGYGMPKTPPPLAGVRTIEEVEAFNWPDPNWMDVTGIPEQAAPYRDEYAILGGDWSPYWHDVIDLTGHVELYYMIYDAPEVLERIFERVTDFYQQVSRNIFDYAGNDIDIFFIGNDFGGQTGPLMSPEQFRRFLLPSMKRLIDLGHGYGKPVMLHCCGGYRELIPDLIEAGIDGLQALQPDAAGMEPAELKKEFGSKIVLNGSIDSKRVLINGPSPDFVREETRKVLEIMQPGGRYIASASHDAILEETPVENVLAMFESIEEFGAYN
ncbi:MAG: hypothetical protein K9L68_02370 [Spirochaetales bacterium]|nr:hypothetical protein [Spirochaetales bacterium]MCF7937421.1 hypothetical protein [Spirochaetales bacterium]